MNIKLIPLQEHEKETFIRNIQIAFKKAVVEQFGPFDEEIIPRDHVIRSFEAEGAESYNIVLDGEVVGGAVLAIHPDTNRNELQLLFVNVDCKTVLDQLYHAYAESHESDPTEISDGFKELDKFLEGLSLDDNNAVWNLCCQICTAYEHKAFIDGLLYGAFLMREVFGLI